MNKIIKNIMNHASLVNKPPVLFDIGASGFIHRKWRSIAKYSVCIAFDADTRDFDASITENKNWRKLIKLNRLVTETPSNGVNFYLTQSPHCSSTLLPDETALEPWAFNQLFKVVDTLKLPATDIKTALKETDLEYIDWFKTDSQGTDLRIFCSIPEKIVNNILTAEFEPGIIDAMKGEDKLHSLMSYMDTKPFWVSNMKILGSNRINKIDLSSLNYFQKLSLGSFLKTAPGWCEITYINTLKSDNLSIRQYLLTWLFSTLNGEHGFGLFIARKGFEIFKDPIFLSLKKKSYRKLSHGYLKFMKHVFRRLIISRFQWLNNH